MGADHLTIIMIWLREMFVPFEYAPIKIGTMHSMIFELVRVKTSSHILHILGDADTIIIHEWDRHKYNNGDAMLELHPDSTNVVELSDPNAAQLFMDIVDAYRP